MKTLSENQLADLRMACLRAAVDLRASLGAVTADEFVSAAARFEAYVTGDGTDALEALKADLARLRMTPAWDMLQSVGRQEG